MLNNQNLKENFQKFDQILKMPYFIIQLGLNTKIFVIKLFNPSLVGVRRNPKVKENIKYKEYKKPYVFCFICWLFFFLFHNVGMITYIYETEMLYLWSYLS